jgi:HEAT repeat protein
MISRPLNQIEGGLQGTSAENELASGYRNTAKKILKIAFLFTGFSVAGTALLFFQVMLCSQLYSQNNTAVTRPEQQHSPDPKLQEIITTLQKGNSDERQRAAIALSTEGDASAVEPLIKALDDSDDFVRDFSVRALGSLRDSRAVEPLIKALDDKSLLVRRSAATALGSIGDSRAVKPLVKALDDNNPLMRRSAARALGSVGDPSAVDALIRILGDDDIYISNAAAVALAKIGSSAIPRLAGGLADWTTGPKVAEVLENLGWQPSSDEEKVRFDVARRNRRALLEQWEIARRILINDANSENSRQVRNAVFALIGIGRDDVLNDLARILRERGDGEMARVFSGCGNAFLAEAAQSWVKDHRADLDGGTAKDSAVEWGKLDSSQISVAATSAPQ